MVLRVAIDVPDAFRPKAEYALRVLLAPLDCEICYTDAADLAENGGLYYGFSPLPFRSNTKPVLAIASQPETWAFFSSFTPYPHEAFFFVTGDEGRQIPVLFGAREEASEKNGVNWFYTDLVASAFYWLSDWEYFSRSERDRYDRLPYQGSLVQQLNLQSRAVVDEYADLLARLLDKLEIYPIRPHTTTFSAVFSHDLDRIRKKTPGIAVRETIDFLMMNRMKQPLKTRLSRWGKSLRQLTGAADVYEASIQQLFDEEKERGIRGCYLFKSVLNRHVNDARDYLSSPFFNHILQLVKRNDAEMGYHSGYLSGSLPDQLRAEFGRLCDRTGHDLYVHRSHYLRFHPPVTFPMLETLGMRIDSSVSWAEITGFRAQTCRPYPLFNVAENRGTSILEIPLSVMDTQPFGYQKLSPDQARVQVAEIIHTVKRHNGVMVWNFHHHIHDPIDAPHWDDLLAFAYDTCAAESVTFNEVYEAHAPIYF